MSFVGNDRYLPTVRYKKILAEGDLDAMAVLSRNPQREAQFAFIEQPLYAVRHRVVTRADLGLELVSVDQVQQHNLKVVALHGTGSAKHAIPLFGEDRVDDASLTVESMLRKVASGRGDVAYYHDIGLLQGMRTPEVAADLTIHPTAFHEYHHYFALRKDAPQDWVTAITAGLRDLSESGQLDVIVAKYVYHDEVAQK